MPIPIPTPTPIHGATGSPVHDSTIWRADAVSVIAGSFGCVERRIDRTKGTPRSSLRSYSIGFARVRAEYRDLENFSDFCENWRPLQEFVELANGQCFSEVLQLRRARATGTTSRTAARRAICR